MGAVHGLHLDASIGGEVAPELSQVLAVVVLQNEDGVARVFLHVVLIVRHDLVKAVLQTLNSPYQGDFLRVVFERDNGQVLPVVLFRTHVQVVDVLVAVGVRSQHLTGVHIPVDAVNRVNLYDIVILKGRPIFAQKVRVEHTKAHGELSMSVVDPNWEHLVAGEHLEAEVALFVQIDVQECDAAQHGFLAEQAKLPVDFPGE